jgi:hypothetical protein
MYYEILKVENVFILISEIVRCFLRLFMVDKWEKNILKIMLEKRAKICAINIYIIFNNLIKYIPISTFFNSYDWGFMY